MSVGVQRVRLSVLVGLCLGIAACGGDDSPSTPTADNGRPSAGAATPGGASGTGGASGGATSGGNRPPVIEGKPATAVVQDTQYSFQPKASDPDGDSLTFKIDNLPEWATFSTANGRLQGKPSPADVGVYENIVISVSDGKAESALEPFSINVQATGSGSAVLSWIPPTENTDGSPLTDLAGYKLYWGTSPGEYPNSISIDNPGVTTYVVENLAPATYYFVATALNSEGAESEPSNMATSTIL
ncbi:MAG TPA: putative Ig domain-containing protein [Gammaproteobacteria bacterium]